MAGTDRASAHREQPPRIRGRASVRAFATKCASARSPSLSSPRVAATSKERSLPVAPIASAPEDTIARAPAPPPESEILLLERAKARVDSDPQSALALVDEHAVRFPAGMLVQEAEVIAIEALTHAGSTAAAASRLARFRQRFAGSAYLPHLETVIRQKK
jgi:hypothetical protein